MNSEQLEGGECEEDGVLKDVAEATTATRSKRNPCDAGPTDRFDSDLVLPAKADDVDFMSSASERVDLPTDSRIDREVRVRYVANPHRTAATVKMTARQTIASKAHRMRTISHSRRRFQRITAWASDSTGPFHPKRPSGPISP